jgi:hypothetical protein
VGGFQVADAAVLDERDPPACEFELEQVGVVGGTHQHGLVAQADAAFVVGEHPLGDQGGFLCLVAAAHELGLRTVVVVGVQDSRVAALGLCGDFVSDRDDRPARAVVALQRDDLRVREAVGEAEQVLGARGSEAVDRLQVVADDGQGG